MTIAEFEHQLLRHGSRLERWPEAERRAAEALLASDTAALGLWQEAQRLDALLGEATAAAPTGSALTGAILARVRGRKPAREPLLAGWRLAGAGAGLGAIAIAGFILGFVNAGATDASADAMLLAVAGAEAAMWWPL